MVETIAEPRKRYYNVIKLSFENFYDNGTKPEGNIFTFCKRLTRESPLSEGWKAAHWTEIVGLLTDKYYLSERGKQNCGLINAARDYFGREENALRLVDLVSKHGLSLPELSLVIKENDSNKIFIPNFSISFAKEGILKPRGDYNEFFNSDSYNILRNLVQIFAANPDLSVSHKEQSTNLFNWMAMNGEKAMLRLRESMKFKPKLLYVEGESPDLALKELGHRPFEEIAEEFTLEKFAKIKLL